MAGKNDKNETPLQQVAAPNEADRADERDGHEDERLHRRSDPAREDRALSDRRVTEDRELTDEERVEMFNMAFFAEVLPALPPIPGFHLCWLTTTNPRDTIQMRSRLGYTPVRADEVPGWEHAKIATGTYAGLIGINEMVAFKLPDRLYQKYMAEAHHNEPQRQDDKLRARINQMSQEAQEHKGRIIEEEGMADIGKSRPVPVFQG